MRPNVEDDISGFKMGTFGDVHLSVGSWVRRDHIIQDPQGFIACCLVFVRYEGYGQRID